MNLYVVRHGETIWNVEKKVQGTTDIPLTDKGREEAKSPAAAKNAKRKTIRVIPPARMKYNTAPTALGRYCKKRK